MSREWGSVSSEEEHYMADKSYGMSSQPWFRHHYFSLEFGYKQKYCVLDGGALVLLIPSLASLCLFCLI